MTSARKISLLGAALALALAAAAALLLFGRGSVGPADALGQAAERTAGLASGVATVKVLDGPVSADITTRWDGQNAEVAVDQKRLDGTVEHRELRLVDGTLYQRSGDGAWSSQAWQGGETGLEGLQASASTQTLADAVQAASDVTRDGDTYSATVPASAAAALGNVLALDDPAGPLEVEVTQDTDGLIDAVSVGTAQGSHELDYSQLGEPQQIVAPQ